MFSDTCNTDTMDTKQDRSYGVIPVRRTKDGEWEVLIIHQFSSLRGDSYWILPKGHPDPGETPTETAARELLEETGLQVTSLDTEHPFMINYTFVHDGTRIAKQVTFYIGEVTDGPLRLHETELKEARWCTFAEARELLSHENSRRMFDEVVAYVDTWD